MIYPILKFSSTPINHVPTLFGRRIDLLTMYNAVAQRGGLKKVSDKHEQAQPIVMA